MLNVALFGMTAKEWRDAHPDDKRNIRDYATINQLICLNNIENLNAVFINEGRKKEEKTEPAISDIIGRIVSFAETWILILRL